MPLRRSESEVCTICLAMSGRSVSRPRSAERIPRRVNHFAIRGSFISWNWYEPRDANRRALLSSFVNVKSEVGQSVIQNRSSAAWFGCHQERNT